MNSNNRVPVWLNGYKAINAARPAAYRELLDFLLCGETGLSTESQTDE